MLENTFFSLMIDESTDHTLEQHRIVYENYLKSKGLGPCWITERGVNQ
jgi:hypothetical protein